MKKLLFALTAVVLLAAGCKGSQTATVDYNTGNQQAANPPPPAAARVTVNSPDDAVNLILNNFTSEQPVVAAGDDSDLSTSDSAELNSFTEVGNDY